MADLVWYQGETVRVLCSFQALGLPVAVDPDFSVKLLGWQGTDLSTLFIDRAGTIITGPGGYVQIDLPPNLSAMPAGAYQVQIKVYDPTGTDMGIGLSGVAQVLASPDNTAIFDGPFTEVDWTNVDEYTGTATHGPVRPHSGTLEVKATNGDGSISIGVKDGLYDPAGAAAAAQAAAEAASLPVGGTAADVNPAGTAIAAALALLVGKVGDQVMSGKLTIQKTGGGTNLTLERTDGVRMQIGAGMAGNIICNGQYSFTWDGLATDVTPITLIHPTLAGNSVGQIRFRRFGSTAPHGDSTAAANRLLGFADSAEGQLKVVLEAVLNSLRANGAGGLSLQDSTGAEHALLTSTGLRIRPRIVSTSITAELDGVYHGTAAATYTDPTPAEGRGYLVRVVNGTQTVGGIAYAAEGTVIFREYHSGAWRNRVLFGGADAAGVRANLELATVAQAEAEAGTATTTRAWTAERVKQAILALSPPTVPTTTTTSQSTSYSWQPSRNGDVLKLTLTGAVALTLSDPATTTVPLHVTVEAIQDGNGGRVLTLAGNVSTPGAVQPTLSATANAVDLLQFVWTGSKWRWVNSSYAQGNL